MASSNAAAPFELIITEKPSSAKKIAEALANGKPNVEKQGGISIYKITHGNKDIVIGCAVGHLYGLAENKDKNEKKGWTYPTFDVKWKPSADVNKASAHTRKYITALRKAGKGASEYTIATDYDIEGEVIGHNILHFLFKKKDGNRMKFSALTKKDIVNAYEHKSKTIDWGQANAGLTRHELDWYYGINISRALTGSVKAAGSFKILSSGRVQTPALKIVVDREKEIKAFKPEPYWQIQLTGNAKGEEIIAMHETDKFWKKEEADTIFNKTKGKKANVDEVNRREFKQAPPVPFDLTTLQTEAYRSLRIKPKRTLEIAQELYTAGIISYPRTSSQELPDSIGIPDILKEIAKQEYYTDLANKLISAKKFKPNNGKKKDPAHPAIYPTGAITHLEEEKQKLYDLIVRRFLATMSDPATRETMQVKIDVNKEIFITKGTRTIEKGWHEFYGHHVKMEEETMPPVAKGDCITKPNIKQLAKETQPPKRYTAASIIKELEKRGLGTKATRANIVETLYNRGYTHNDPLEATKLGILTLDVLEKYSPAIADEKLTKKFEEEMEEIRKGKKNGPEILKEAKKILEKILAEFKQKEKEIGSELIDANRTASHEMNLLGPCPACGGSLLMKKGKFGNFVGCDKYPDCKQTYKLPSRALIKSAKKNCEICNTPKILVLKKGKKPQELCLNLDCPGKIDTEHEAAIEKALQEQCPDCGGSLIKRKSIYGDFVGCANYPKCKFTKKLESHKKEGKKSQLLD